MFVQVFQRRPISLPPGCVSRFLCVHVGQRVSNCFLFVHLTLSSVLHNAILSLVWCFTLVSMNRVLKTSDAVTCCPDTEVASLHSWRAFKSFASTRNEVINSLHAFYQGSPHAVRGTAWCIRLFSQNGGSFHTSTLSLFDWLRDANSCQVHPRSACRR